MSRTETTRPPAPRSTKDTIIAVDIGSTWTKAAQFSHHKERLHLVRRVAVPTTVSHLPVAVHELLTELRRDSPEAADCPVVCSSSAKGGLSVVAVGIVPDLTLAMARQTALSAGARISRVFAYELTTEDILAIDAIAPDIVLVTGGTDGGNREYVERNSQLLTRLSSRPHIVYAGNRTMAETVCNRLAAFPVVVTENILPELDSANPEPARAAIRDIFIGSIAHGKGLDELNLLIDEPVEPTPLVVYEFVRTMAQSLPRWSRFCLVDLGGATTDVYSTGASAAADGQRVVQKGPPPPATLRTVEGDLGMRVSAPAAAEAQRSFFGDDVAQQEMSDHAAAVHREPQRIASTDAERACDRLLAAACVSGALTRHAGRIREVFTPQGAVWLQTGTDLRGVDIVVGSGGYLASDDFETVAPLVRWPQRDEQNRTVLLPESPLWYRDRENLLPLLANAARRFQRAACVAAADHWREETP
ncbi:MAG: glutamate mutase [Spirochaetaceae bacterium]|nr:MAG: glutamate mutase [Spirochaetaceae bacterium]